MPDSIEDSIETTATDGIKRVRIGNQEVEALPVDEQIKADQYVKGNTAKSKDKLGLLFRKLVPPGAG